eukprot:16296763-Heterocapsa_arctica.AAC.1
MVSYPGYAERYSAQLIGVTCPREPYADELLRPINVPAYSCITLVEQPVKSSAVPTCKRTRYLIRLSVKAEDERVFGQVKRPCPDPHML